MGNALADGNVPDPDKDLVREGLLSALPTADSLVAEHIQWALDL
jgi:epoxyqueuosine reductase